MCILFDVPPYSETYQHDSPLLRQSPTVDPVPVTATFPFLSLDVDVVVDKTRPTFSISITPEAESLIKDLEGPFYTVVLHGHRCTLLEEPFSTSSPSEEPLLTLLVREWFRNTPHAEKAGTFRFFKPPQGSALSLQWFTALRWYDTDGSFRGTVLLIYSSARTDARSRLGQNIDARIEAVAHLQSDVLIVRPSPSGLPCTSDSDDIGDPTEQLFIRSRSTAVEQIRRALPPTSPGPAQKSTHAMIALKDSMDCRRGRQEQKQGSYHYISYLLLAGLLVSCGPEVRRAITDPVDVFPFLGATLHLRSEADFASAQQDDRSLQVMVRIMVQRLKTVLGARRSVCKDGAEMIQRLRQIVGGANGIPRSEGGSYPYLVDGTGTEHDVSGHVHAFLGPGPIVPVPSATLSRAGSFERPVGTPEIVVVESRPEAEVQRTESFERPGDTSGNHDSVSTEDVGGRTGADQRSREEVEQADMLSEDGRAGRLFDELEDEPQERMNGVSSSDEQERIHDVSSSDEQERQDDESSSDEQERIHSVASLQPVRALDTPSATTAPAKLSPALPSAEARLFRSSSRDVSRRIRASSSRRSSSPPARLGAGARRVVEDHVPCTTGGSPEIADERPGCGSSQKSSLLDDEDPAELDSSAEPLPKRAPALTTVFRLRLYREDRENGGGDGRPRIKIDKIAFEGHNRVSVETVWPTLGGQGTADLVLLVSRKITFQSDRLLWKDLQRFWNVANQDEIDACVAEEPEDELERQRAIDRIMLFILNVKDANGSRIITGERIAGSALPHLLYTWMWNFGGPLPPRTDKLHKLISGTGVTRCEDDDLSTRANSPRDSPVSSDVEPEPEDGDIAPDGMFSIAPELSWTGDPESEAGVGESVPSSLSTADTDWWYRDQQFVGDTDWLLDRTIGVCLPRYWTTTCPLPDSVSSSGNVVSDDEGTSTPADVDALPAQTPKTANPDTLPQASDTQPASNTHAGTVPRATRITTATKNKKQNRTGGLTTDDCLVLAIFFLTVLFYMLVAFEIIGCGSD